MTQMSRLVLVLAAALLAAPLHAATYTWTGAVSALWNEPGNWSPAGVPGADDDAVFPSSAARKTVGDYSETVAVRSLSFGAGYDLNLRIDLGASLALTATPIQVDLGTLRLAGPNTWSVGEPVLNTVSSLTGSVDVGPHALEIIGGGASWQPASISGSGPIAALQTSMIARAGTGQFFSGTLDLARLSGYGADMRGTVTVRSVDGSGTFEDLVVLELVEPFAFTYNAAFHAAHLTLGNATSTAVYRRRLDQALVTYSGSATLTNASFTVVRGSAIVREREAITILRGATPVTGTFVGLPEGAEVTVDDQVYRIRYDVPFGNEHDVRLEWLRNTNTRTWTGAADALWSNPANWSPVGIPAAGEELAFPEGARLTTVNDLSVSAFGKLWIYDAYEIGGNELVLTRGIHGPMTPPKEVTIRNDVRLAAGSEPAILWGPLTFEGVFDVNGRTNVGMLMTVTFDGPLTGSGALSMNWAGTIAVRSPASDYSGTFSGGRLVLDTSLPAASVDGTRASSDLVVNGEQSVGDVTVSASYTVTTPDERHGGVLVLNSSAGDARGLVHTGAFRMGYVSPFPLFPSGYAHYFVDVDASSSDQVDVTGTVWLHRATLTVNVVQQPAANSVFTIVRNDGTDAVTGTFWMLPEGAIFTSDGVDFQISYVGGDGNDVTLTVRASTIATTTAVSSTSASSEVGMPATFAVAVQPAPPGGTVSLRIDGSEVAVLPLVDGAASYSTSALSVGSHDVVAVYGGAGMHGASTSAPLTHVVRPANTTIDVVAAPALVTVGTKFMIGVALRTEGTPPVAPTGVIRIFEGATGAWGAVLARNGMAAVEVTLATVGPHTLTIWYEGDGTYGAAERTIIVNATAAKLHHKRRAARK